MTNQHPQWGWASFGKRDGFEWLSMNAALKAFESQKESLGTALQLRLEDVRIFPDTEIVGVTRLNQGDDCWQFFTLYRYTLDIYKRDGFYAGVVGLKNASAHPKDLLFYLRRLTDQTRQLIRKETLTVNLPELEARPLAISWEESTQKAFIPFGTTDLNEQLAFIKALMGGELPEYRQVLASNDLRVIRSVDGYKYKRLARHPFYDAPALPVTPEAPQALTYEEDEEREPIVRNSLVHAFEMDASGTWGGSNSANGNGHPKEDEQKGFLAGIFRLLGVKK